MRLYLYISKAVEVHRLPDILNVSRKNNEARGVTGVITYNRGYYLQAIEGESAQMDELIDVLKSDTRHADAQTILDVVSDRHYFSGAMNLSPQLSKDSEFSSLMKDVGSQLSRHSNTVKELFDLFYPLTPKAIRQAASRTVKTKAVPVMYKVTHWPDFNTQTIGPDLLSLCARLLHKPTLYAELVSSNIYQSEAELKRGLHELRKVGCLTICQNDSMVEKSKKVVIESKSKLASSPTLLNRMKGMMSNEVKPAR